jgi:hypothetical protein
MISVDCWRGFQILLKLLDIVYLDLSLVVPDVPLEWWRLTPFILTIAPSRNWLCEKFSRPALNFKQPNNVPQIISTNCKLTMRVGLVLGRHCLRHGSRNVHSAKAYQRFRFSLPKQTPTRHGNFRRPIAGVVVLAASLTPAAFVKLADEDTGDDVTGEERMLKASRAEIQKTIPDHSHGIKRLFRAIALGLDNYIVEPVCTGLRFLHLVVIFVPVIITVPVIWLGTRAKDRDNERTGTLWWYSFLVSSMERAGPAFIKARPRRDCYHLSC